MEGLEAGGGEVVEAEGYGIKSASGEAGGWAEDGEVDDFGGLATGGVVGGAEVGAVVGWVTGFGGE